MTQVAIREMREAEFPAYGDLLEARFSAIEGMPAVQDSPEFYHRLRAAGKLSLSESATALAAVDPVEGLVGGVLLLHNAADYSSLMATRYGAGTVVIRHLAVRADQGGRGIGRQLVSGCIATARRRGSERIILHTSSAMKAAWRLYSSMGFVRVPEDDGNKYAQTAYAFQMTLAPTVSDLEEIT